MNDHSPASTVTPADEQLLARARTAAKNAYAPYSQFRVGAALESTDGSVTTACNVENASYGLVVCAERSAIAAAVAQGHRTFTTIAIWVDGDNGQPCGACRQTIAEFGLDIRVIYRSGGDTIVATARELLPDAFVPATLSQRA